MAKQYISSKGVSYQDFDVSSDVKAREEMIKISGQMGVPVIVVDGEIIVGFDRNRLDELLSIQEEE
jgi:glutaredoxin